MQNDRFNASAMVTLLTIALGFGMVGCTSNETPTETSGRTSPEMAAAKTYTAVDLGALSGPSGFGSFSLASDINAAGQVVGISGVPGSFDAHAFLWEKGVMTDLRTLGGNFSQALGINPAGEVVGWSFILPPSPENAKHAFLWKHGVMTDLGTLGGTESVAWDINPRG